MKRIGVKVGLSIGCSMALFILFTMHTTFSFAKRHAEEIINQQTELAMAFDLAIRDYVDKSVRPEMYKIVPKEEFIPEIMSTSFVARSVFERVREQFPQYVLKFSSDNPRNPKNFASPEEQRILDFFNANPDVKVWSGQIRMDGKDYMARFRARRMVESCLRCHGDPQDAPASLINRYGSTAGFNRRAGQVIALDTIAVPLQYSSSSLWEEFRKIGTLFGAAFALLIGVSVFSFRSIVTNRLSRIAHHFNSTAKENDSALLELITVTGNDEISLMAKSYNTLAERLKNSYLHLEDQVRRRTRELEAANLTLQQEIDNHRHTGDTLRESERKYRNILESIAEGYFEISQTGAFTFFNDQFCALTGNSRHVLTEAKFFDFIPPPLAARMTDVIQRTKTLATAERVSDFLFIDGQGNQAMFDLSLSAMRDEAGQTIGWRGVIRDISELLRVQEDLRKSGAFHKTILDSMQEAVAIIDARSSSIVAVNRRFCQDFSVAEEEVIGRPCYEATHKSHQRCAPPLHPCPCTSTLHSGKHATEEHIHYLDDGSAVYVEISTFPLFDEKGSVERVVHISKDISLRKNIDFEREAARQAAEEANRAKSEFLANMSHEIRTPLNGIVGMVELAIDTNLDDHQKNIFYTINAEVNSLLGIINDILDFSKIEAGRLELESVPFNLRELVEDVANGIALAAQNKRIGCLCYLPPEMPDLVTGDPGRLRQIVKNLAGNAVKFTERGEIFIKGELASQKDTSITVRFEVTDTGIGIAKEKLGDIFESFKQADGSTTRKYGGTGLGTAISKQLAELMGGEIGAESEPGKGSTFWFTARLSTANENPEPQRAEAEVLEGKRILIADSCQNNRYILAEYLRSWGCLPEEAPDGREALTAYLQNTGHVNERSIDLIIADSQILEMDGWRLFRQIREISALRHIPILALTSIGTGNLFQEKALVGFLTKPIRRDKLLLALASLLAGKTPHSATVTDEVLAVKPSSLQQRLSGGKYRILLVEDYPTNQQVAVLHLEAAGLTVELAANGQAAVMAFQQQPYDLILMDVQMPVMDGYQAAQAIRRIETAAGSQTGVARQRIPIIAMTAHATPQDRQACLDAGMDDYIAKPLRRKDFLAKVEHWLLRSGHRAGAEELAAEKQVSSDVPRAAVLDLDRAIKEFEGDRAIVLELLREFLALGPAQIEIIHQNIANNAFESAAREAHSIKGGAANMTADSLAAAAHALELAAKRSDGNACAEALRQVTLEFQRLEEAASSL